MSFVKGLPLLVIECKKPGVPARAAFNKKYASAGLHQARLRRARLESIVQRHQLEARWKQWTS
jgi:type I site-specific restriction-modification system R (restriction) subunit